MVCLIKNRDSQPAVIVIYADKFKENQTLDKVQCQFAYQTTAIMLKKQNNAVTNRQTQANLTENMASTTKKKNLISQMENVTIVLPTGVHQVFKNYHQCSFQTHF